MSGIGNDARDVTKAANAGDHRAQLTFAVQSKRIVDYIAAYYVYMGGCDAIAFTAGVAENIPYLRQRVVERLECLGAKLDYKQNDTLSDERRISTPDSKIEIWIVPTNEELLIARDTIEIGRAHV